MFWLLEVSVLYAYTVDATRLTNLQHKPLTHLQFRRALIQGLASHRLNVTPSRSPGGHVPREKEACAPFFRGR